MIYSSLTVAVVSIAIAIILGSVDVTALRLRGSDIDADANTDIPDELKQAVDEWRSRVATSPHVTKSVQDLKASFKARSNGRELRDVAIVRAMEKARAKRPPMFSLEWAKKFEGSNPFVYYYDENATEDNANGRGKYSTFDGMRKNRQRRGQENTDKVIGIGISALSPGFPWNPHLQAGEGEPEFYCAGAALTDPPGTDSPVRPTRNAPMTLIDCENLNSERERSQITFEYTAEGELNFTDVSENDPFTEPWGWCVGLKNVNKNQLLRSQYCDKADITQVWRILPWDNTWRPDAAWWNINGGGICVEASSSNLTQYETQIQLERCTYDDQAARQRQTWVWCYEETTCKDEDSTPPNFSLTIECDIANTQRLTCSSSTIIESTATSDGAGAVQESIYDEINNCPDDPVRNQRWGRSQVYLVSDVPENENLIVDFDSNCDDDGNDANNFMRVYTKQSDGEYDCEFLDNTRCEDDRQTMSAVVDPSDRDYLIVVTADGSDGNDANYNLDVSCSTSHYVLIQFRGNNDNTNFCIGVDNSNSGQDVELKRCDPDDNNMLWELDDDRLLRLRANDGRCMGVANTNNNQVVELVNCNPDRDNQRWRYDSQGDNEFSVVSNNNRCITTEDGADPSNGDRITITNCDGNSDQRWNYGFVNPLLPSTSSSSDEYCFSDENIINVESDNENLPRGSYDNNACLEPSDVFETEDNLRNAYLFYDTQGIEFTLSIVSDCSSGRGIDSSDSAGYTLYRVYEVDEDDNSNQDEFECRFSAKTECKKESDEDQTVSFNLDGQKRYLFVATGSIELVPICEVDDSCTAGLADARV